MYKMWRKSLFIVIIAISAIFIFLIFFNGNRQPISREDVHSVQVKNEQVETEVELESEIKKGKSFTSSITIPLTKVDKNDQQIKDCAHEKENEFFNENEAIRIFLGENIYTTFSIDTKVKKVNNYLFSYKMEIYQYINEENEYKEWETFVVNLKERKIVPFEEIFSINDKN